MKRLFSRGVNRVKGIKCASPGISAGEEATCHAGDPDSIPGSGRSPGEGIGYPLQYFASLVAQIVKNPPAMQETWVRSLGWEDSLDEGMATHSSILGIPLDRGSWWAMAHGVNKESDMTKQLSTAQQGNQTGLDVRRIWR